MIRKTLLALAATVAVGAALLTPTTASAWHHHHVTATTACASGVAIAAPVVWRRATGTVSSRPVVVCVASW